MHAGTSKGACGVSRRTTTRGASAPQRATRRPRRPRPRAWPPRSVPGLVAVRGQDLRQVRRRPADDDHRGRGSAASRAARAASRRGTRCSRGRSRGGRCARPGANGQPDFVHAIRRKCSCIARGARAPGTTARRASRRPARRCARAPTSPNTQPLAGAVAVVADVAAVQRGVGGRGLCVERRVAAGTGLASALPTRLTRRPAATSGPPLTPSASTAAAVAEPREQERRVGGRRRTSSRAVPEPRPARG